MKENGFFKQKYGNCESLAYFQIYEVLGLKKTQSISTMLNLKIITTLFILMNRDSRRKMVVLVKARFWTFQQKSIIENLPLFELLKEVLFPFISIKCPIWIAIYHQKYFMLQSIMRFYMRFYVRALIRMIKRVNVFLKRMKKQCSECTCVHLIIEKNFLGDSLNYFISFQIRLRKLLRFFVCSYFQICVCASIFLCINECVYVHFMFVVYDGIYIYCSVFVLQILNILLLEDREFQKVQLATQFNCTTSACEIMSVEDS